MHGLKTKNQEEAKKSQKVTCILAKILGIWIVSGKYQLSLLPMDIR